MFHIDDVPSGAGEGSLDPKKAKAHTSDPISCLCASDKYLIIARETGMISLISRINISLSRERRVWLLLFLR